MLLQYLCIADSHSGLSPDRGSLCSEKHSPQFSPLDIDTSGSNQGCLYRKNIFETHGKQGGHYMHVQFQVSQLVRQVALLQLPVNNSSLSDAAFLPSMFFSNLAIRQKTLEIVLDSFIMEQ